MTMHYLGDDHYSLEEQEEMEREKNKNYDVWKLEIRYSTGDSEKTYEKTSCLPILWKSKDKAKKVMKEILTRRAFMNEHSSKIRKKEDVEEVFDWMVFHETGVFLGYQMSVELDNGERQIVSAFWDEDTFTHIRSMRVVRETEVEDDDEVIF